jgi:uncharacterized protein
MKYAHKVSFLLIVIGGLNLLVLGLTGWDLGQLFGGQSALASKIIYIVIGLAAVYEIASHKGCCKECIGQKSG